MEHERVRNGPLVGKVLYTTYGDAMVVFSMLVLTVVDSWKLLKGRD